MGITLTIVGGLILLTFIPVFFDYLSKKQKNAGRSAGIEELSRRVETLEAKVYEKDDQVKQLREELAFVNRLLEDKSAR